MSVSTGDIVSRVYGNFRGVDFRGEEINIRRSPDSLNVWKDYKETESIRTRPGMKKAFDFSEPVYGIYFYNGEVIIQSGSWLYKIKNGEQSVLWSDLGGKGQAFIYENVWYFKTESDFIQYDGKTVIDVEGYVPTTTIGRRPAGGGEKHEDVNMLSPFRKNTFLADGYKDDNGNIKGSTIYYLDTTECDNYEPEVYVDGEKYTGEYQWDAKNGIIHFREPIPAPDTDGQDNVLIKFQKEIEGYRANILKSTLLQVFDNRVFVSGNPDHPNVVWHCSLNDPTYWSDLDYYREGMDDAAIKGLVAGNNALWVFREPSDSNTNVFYHTPTIDSEYGKIYPSSHSSITIGCVGKAINFNDDIVFFSNRGMEGISGDVTTEQAVAHRSSLVDGKMLPKNETERNAYKDMLLEEWEGYLLCIIGNKVYLADSRTAFTNENHIEYEWFYWELEKDILCTRVHGGKLYLGTADGVYTLDDMNANVESYWVTPKDKFNSAHKLKTTNKRGCVAEATGDITVYAKTEDTGFELIGEYNGVTDYFVSRIKRKKFKDIQLKFYSKTRFSLETVTLECFIGGYIKR